MVAWSIVAILAVAILDCGAGWLFPAKDEATVDLPGTRRQLVLKLRSTHPFLAEYDRRLILRKDGMELGGLELMNDSGGYGRAQLYRLSDGMFALLGSFQFVRFDAASGAFSSVDIGSLRSWRGARRSPIVPGDAVYLGAFDRDREHRWRFQDALESPEFPMTPSG